MEFDRPLRVRLVRECELVRAGLTQMLAEHHDRLRVLPPDAGPDEPADIALVDPFARHGDRTDGPTAVTRPPDTAHVVVFSWEVRDGFVERVMLGGADGYLSKHLPAAELVAALEKVHAGERIVALDLVPLDASRTPRALGLTPRESHVVSLIAAGAPNKEIARRLGLSMNTVKSHIRTAYRAMGVASRTQAVLWAVEHGITAPWVAVRDEVAS
ncbi:MAG TPA: response regulator transcription factor [Nocardioides sp.]|uniref:response regulator transcription factor n=1 Tax=Nocardioides sp. TaxID=35761 RepID=UPI002E33CE2C|nr:response regulator transcription factor [Nocardioides sp.]HEX3931120.1 response regulator transcription factor [Nocardioides sp.]